MFLGHYAVGFGLKKSHEEIPLWLLFLAVQFVDILAFLFVLLGIEKIRYNPSSNPFLRTIIDYVPYSHSLLTNLLLAGAVWWVFSRWKGRKWGIALALGVVSHWFLDLLVHLPDMPLLHDSLKVGLGLWRFPRFAFVLELCLFLFAGLYLLKGHARPMRVVVLMLLLSAGFTGMFFAPEAEATAAAASLMSLSLYATFAAMAFWSERKPKGAEEG